MVNGQPEPNVKVYVYEPGTTNEIPIYEDEGITPITQPILTDAHGRYAFFLNVDSYPEIRLYLEKEGVDFSETNEDLDGVPVPGYSAGGGGASNFLELSDTPSNYEGRSGHVLLVKVAEDGIETQPWPVTGTTSHFFLSDDAADIGSYFYMYPSETGGSHSSIASPSLSIGNDQLLWSFIAEPGAGVSQLALGAYTATLFLKKSGNKAVRVYWKLFKRDTGGTETEILQSAVSDYLTADNSQYLISAYLNEDQVLDPTDRLVFKLFANVSGTGTDVTVTLTMEGNYDSRLTINVLSSAFNLDRLSDVTITSPADNELLAYDSGSGKWTNQTPSEAGILAADGSVPLTGDLDFDSHSALNLKSTMGIVNAATFPGADIGEKINNAIDYAYANDKAVFVPFTKEDFSTTITLKPVPIYFNDARLNYTGSGIAVQTDPSTRLGYQVYGLHVSNGGTGTVGLYLNGCYQSEFHINRIYKFDVGLKLYSPDAAHYCSWNQIYINNIRDCKNAILLTRDSNGFVNANSFFGAQLDFSGDKTDTIGIKLETGVDNAFTGMFSIENYETGIYINSNRNRFDCVHLEGCAPYLKLTSSSSLNSIVIINQPPIDYSALCHDDGTLNSITFPGGLPLIKGNVGFQNLLQNSSFEDWTGTSFPSWLSQGTIACNTNSDYIKHGSRSAALTADTEEARIYQNITGDILKLLRGQIVVFSAWVYATVADKVFLDIYDGSGHYSYKHQGTGWELLYTGCEVNNSTNLIRVTIRGYAGAGTFYADACSLTVGTIVPLYQPPFFNEDNQAAAQADSTATDVDGLRADFNALLQKLRDAKLMAT